MTDPPTAAHASETRRFKVTGDVYLRLLDNDKILFYRRTSLVLADVLPDRMIAYCRSALEHVAHGQPFPIYGW